MTTHRAIQISKISKDKDLQLRAEMSEEKILDYMEAYRRGDNIPPIVLFREEQPELGAAGPIFWLADGWHRAEAEERLGSLVVNAIIKEGDKKAAKFYALTANATNGLDLSQADRRKIITTLFVEFEEWRERGDREIARQLKLRHHDLVSTIRKELQEAGTIPEAKSRTVTRGGKTFTQKASKESPASGGTLHSRDRSEIDRDTQGVFGGANFGEAQTSANQSANQECKTEEASDENLPQTPAQPSTLQTSANGTRKPVQTPLAHCDSKDCWNPPRTPSRYCEPCLIKFGAIPQKTEGAEDSAPSNGNGKKEGGYQHYNSPPSLITEVKKLGPIGLDPCHNAGSLWGARATLDASQDSLREVWDWAELAAGDLIPLNPPWGNMLPFVRKLIAAALRGASAVLICQSGSSDTEWWHLAEKSSQLRCALKGRVAYYKDGVEDPNPNVSTTLFYWGPNPNRFAAIFGRLGTLSRYVPEDLYAQASEALRAEELNERQMGLPQVATPEESAPSQPESPASEPRAWLTRQKKALGETLHCEDFDELYQKLYAEASEEERKELESIKEEMRAPKPHRENVKAEQVLATRSPEENPWLAAGLKKLRATTTTQQCEGVRGSLLKAHRINTPEVIAVINGVANAQNEKIQAEAKERARAQQEAANLDEHLEVEAWAPDGNLRKGGYALGAVPRWIDLTRAQFLKWQEDPKVRVRVEEWLSDFERDLIEVNDREAGLKLYDSVIILALTSQESDKVNAIWQAHLRSKEPAPQPEEAPSFSSLCLQLRQGKTREEIEDIYEKAGKLVKNEADQDLLSAAWVDTVGKVKWANKENDPQWQQRQANKAKKKTAPKPARKQPAAKPTKKKPAKKGRR